ncbi:MFS-type transporter VdtG [Exophiala dermatitidis]
MDRDLPSERAGEDTLKDDMSPLEAVTSQPDKYPKGIKLVLVLLSIYLAIFLVALDRTIIATALPKITDHFQSFGDTGWYNAAFLLPTTALQLFFGRMYTFYSPKWIFLTLVFVFEIGSAVCGAAPSSLAFILGRAISGIGAGGIFNGSMIIMMYAAPLEKRAFYMGLLGAVFGVASVAGPLLGGAFTTGVTWRWCFYINLPIGACVLVFLFLVVEETEPARGGLTLKEKLNHLDIPGTLVFVPCMVCLLLALQWGGQDYAWSSGRVIALLVVFGVLLIAFIAIQFWRQDNGTVPPRIAQQRTVASAAWIAFCLGSTFLLVVYYLSIWFQAIKGDSAITSGYSTLPSLLSLVIASILSGAFISRVGYYNPSIIACTILMPIGTGLLCLFTPHTRHPMWIGSQFLFGFGTGLGLQQTNIAAQAVLSKADAPTGMSFVFFAQGLGGAISVSVGQNILDSQLIKKLSALGGISPHQVVSTGATQLRDIFPKQQLPAVIEAYNDSLVIVFYAALAYACAALLGIFTLEWKTVKKPTTKDEEKQGPKEEEHTSELHEKNSTSTPEENRLATPDVQEVKHSEAAKPE